MNELQSQTHDTIAYFDIFPPHLIIHVSLVTIIR